MQRFDLVLVDDGGRVDGIGRMVCVFTRQAEVAPVHTIPLLRWKLERLLERQDAVKGSYDEQAVTSLFQALPKDELFCAGRRLARRGGAQPPVRGPPPPGPGAGAGRARGRGRRAARHDAERALHPEPPRAHRALPARAARRHAGRRRAVDGQLERHHGPLPRAPAAGSAGARRPRRGRPRGAAPLPHVGAGARAGPRSALGDRARRVGAAWADRLPASYRDAVPPSVAAPRRGGPRRAAELDGPGLEAWFGAAGDDEEEGVLALTVASAGPERRAVPPAAASSRASGSGWSTSSRGISVTSASTGWASGRSARRVLDGQGGPRVADALVALWEGRADADPLNRLVTVGRDDVARRGDPPGLPPLPAAGRPPLRVRLRRRGAGAAPRRRPHRRRAVPGPLRLGGEGDPHRARSPSWRRPATRSSASTTTASCAASSGTVDATVRTNVVASRPEGPLGVRARLRGRARRPRAGAVPRDLRPRPDGRGGPPPGRTGGPRRHPLQRPARGPAGRGARPDAHPGAEERPDRAHRREGRVRAPRSVAAVDQSPTAVRAAYETFIGCLLDLVDPDDDPYLVVAADKGTAVVQRRRQPPRGRPVVLARRRVRVRWLGRLRPPRPRHHRARRVGGDRPPLPRARRRRRHRLVHRRRHRRHVGRRVRQRHAAGPGPPAARRVRPPRRVPRPRPRSGGRRCAERARLHDLAGSSWQDYDRDAAQRRRRRVLALAEAHRAPPAGSRPPSASRRTR